MTASDEQISYPAGSEVWVKLYVIEEKLPGDKQEHFLRLSKNDVSSRIRGTGVLDLLLVGSEIARLVKTNDSI